MNFKRGLCRLGIHARTSRSCARCKCRMDSASQARGVCAGETPGPGSAAPKFAPTCQLWRSASHAESACTVCGTRPAARCVYTNSESSSPRSAVAAPKLGRCHAYTCRMRARALRSCRRRITAFPRQVDATRVYMCACARPLHLQAHSIAPLPPKAQPALLHPSAPQSPWAQPRPALPYPGLFHRPIYFPTFSRPQSFVPPSH